ncbi:MAG: hypothetical protein FWG11_08705 [Promicromonosporaceae bacterium]|nr:hypothetical protein [Promicromonosporaceae bacterium]
MALILAAVPAISLVGLLVFSSSAGSDSPGIGFVFGVVFLLSAWLLPPVALVLGVIALVMKMAAGRKEPTL